MLKSYAARPLFAGLLWAASLSPALADPAAGIGFVAEADLEYGGDDVANVRFVDGTDQDVSLGQGITVAAGGLYRSSAGSPFSVRGTVGYKYVTTKASNADIHVGRVVLEIVGDYAWPNDWWVGAGVTQHRSIKFEGDQLAPDIRFKDATGPTVEIGWRWIALSYTKLDYEDDFGDKLDASNIGLKISNRF